MSALIAAMDLRLQQAIDAKKMQQGENGHAEHAWSTVATQEGAEDDLQEPIVQLFFQLVRTKNEAQLTKLDGQLEQLLKQLSDTASLAHRPMSTSLSYLAILYRMLLQTRDVVSGKGEYALAYRMILVWYRYFPVMAVRALELFVLDMEPANDATTTKQPFGSWKDLKRFADVCKRTTSNEYHELIQTCIRLTNDQLREDLAKPSDQKISLCAKWVPREGSQYGWLFKRLAEDFYQEEYGNYLHNPEQARKKAYTNYRKMIAGLNRQLDTVQIKQCGNVWAEIDHHKTTSITLTRNKKAFLNVNKKGEQRSERPDRIECAQKFQAYVESRVQSGKEIKGKRVGMNDFTKQALELCNVYDKNKDPLSQATEKDLLNAQWRSSSAAMTPQTLGKMVAMVDTSSSMGGDPLHAAIALGIHVAEKSVLGKRVLTFDTNPAWHNLEGKDDFVSMVESLQNAKWGGSTNFYAGLKLILDALVAQQVPPKDVEGLVLAIFSDMQINQADASYMSCPRQRPSMSGTIHQMYQDAGYTCPHILFWNLRSTSGFPCLSSEPNTSMMSGFSPALLNAFCEKGMEALQTATPWNMMLDILNHERYMLSS